MSGIYWSRKWQATPVFLSGKFHGQRNLAGYRPWVTQGRTWLSTHTLVFTNWSTISGFPGGSGSKASAYNAGDPGSIPGSGRSLGEGNGNPLQYSCLENPMDREAWWATVHGVTKSRTWVSDFTFTTISSLNNDMTIVSSMMSGGTSLVAQSIKNTPAMRETRVQSLGLEDPLEKEMATHANILAWRILWTGEPGGLQSMGSQRVGHDWVTNTRWLILQWSRFFFYLFTLSYSVNQHHQGSFMGTVIARALSLSPVPSYSSILRVKVKWLSRAWLFATPRTIAHQALHPWDSPFWSPVISLMPSDSES